MDEKVATAASFEALVESLTIRKLSPATTKIAWVSDSPGRPGAGTGGGAAVRSAW